MTLPHDAGKPPRASSRRVKTSWSVGPNRFERAVITIDPWQVELGLGWHDLSDYDSRRDVALDEWPSSALRAEAATKFDAATMQEMDASVTAARTHAEFERQRATDAQLASALRRLPLLAPEPIEPGTTAEYGTAYTSGPLTLSMGEPPKPGLARPWVVKVAAGPVVLGDLHAFVEATSGWLVCCAPNVVHFVDRALRLETLDLCSLGITPTSSSIVSIAECGRRAELAALRLGHRAHPRGHLAQALHEAWWLVFDGARVVGRSRP